MDTETEPLARHVRAGDGAAGNAGAWRDHLAGLARLPGVARAVLRHARGSRANLIAYQDRAVQRLVAHAHARVPFYRDLWGRAGVGPDEIRSVADLAKLPVVTKAEMRELPPEALVARGFVPERLILSSTSGSTGRPFHMYNAWLEHRVMHLFRLRAHRQLGRCVGDRYVEIDQPIPVHANDSKLIGRVLRALGLETRLFLSIYEPEDVLLDRLEAFAPDIITSYPSVLARLARKLAEAPRPRLRPRFLISNSEVVTPGLREVITKGWGAPLLEFYDCHECNLIGWECTAGHGLHCNEDVVVVEVLRDGRPAGIGESGEVTITTLHSFAMPFIRFQLGDVVTRGPAPCPCGQPFATLVAVEGRTVDFFELPGGRLLHPYRLIENMDGDGVRWVRQYRLVQERTDRIVFSAVPAGEPDRERLEGFRRYAIEAVGPGVEVVTRFIDRLETDGAKFRPALTRVRSADDPVAWSKVDDA